MRIFLKKNEIGILELKDYIFKSLSSTRKNTTVISGKAVFLSVHSKRSAQTGTSSAVCQLAFSTVSETVATSWPFPLPTCIMQ